MLILLLSLLVLLVIGVPIAYALGLSALAYFLVEQPMLIGVLPQRFFAGINSYALISLPLFILMGFVMNTGGITGRLLDISNFFVGRLKGGLGLVNVVASMVFGGISGSAASDTASIGSVLIPEMKKRGYPAQFAAGITVASSTMGMIIPPSVAMVIYAIAAQESVGQLFLGGVIPGLMVGIFQLAIVWYLSRKNDYPTEAVPFTLAEAWRQIRRSAIVAVMPLLIVGSVVFGIATPTETAGMAVAYGLLIGFLIVGLTSLKQLPGAMRAAILTSAKIMMIIAFSQLYIWVLALERIPDALAAYVISLDLGPIALMLVITAVILVAGTFIDVSPAILLLTPVLLPAAQSVGISGVHFGVVMVSGLAVGACTPPVGNCLNVCAAIARMGIGEIFLGAAPFLMANVLVLILMCIFPQLVLWVPSLFF
ncbi:TRAP transporter large permease [Roseibium album]|uniref:TRAP transporter large permease protein n=1 Tax=Roseibium album TaxID=311410 RepID=A0A0M7B0C1_9HYPH|nr:TRAP transporter large permease [Roseibium album]MBG6147423.1 tripartite ATP-independent transporter DctM subunit [Labrenzia sp. EL_142]MBG6205198.1 tripartite ATP-independent transporter DctM subunit [Labrenzia sp. EL_13]MCR9058043.1 TRAP transporter large permease [Paracoccaceae bacterium]CTQ63408.1 Neu5Ac permease [Roseibium album]CTQ69827.1 Neu5Ac permease [Roseibium album]